MKRCQTGTPCNIQSSSNEPLGASYWPGVSQGNRQSAGASAGAHLPLLLSNPLLLLLPLQQHVVVLHVVVVVQGHRSPVLHGRTIHSGQVGPQHAEHRCALCR